MTDTNDMLDWNRLLAGDARALDAEHQPAFDEVARLREALNDMRRRLEEYGALLPVSVVRMWIEDALGREGDRRAALGGEVKP